MNTRRQLAVLLAGVSITFIAGPLHAADQFITLSNGQTDSGTYVSGNLSVTVASGTATQNGTINEFNFFKEGAGTLSIAGSYYVTGITTVNGGTLSIGSSATFFSNNLSLYNGSTLQVLSNRTLGGYVQFSGGVTFDVPSGAQLSTDASTVALSGSGTLVKTGGGMFIIGPLNQFAADSITVSGGTLQFGDNIHASFNGRLINILNNATVFFSGQLLEPSYAAVISGTGNVVKLRSDTLVLTGTNTYTGGTTISGGTLQLGNGGTTGSITGDVVNYANLTFNRSDSPNFSGAISYFGTVTQAGTGTLTLSGNNSYTGGTLLNAGTLALGSANAIGPSGTISFNGGKLQFTASNAGDYSSRFSNAASQAYNLDTNGQAVTLATALTSTGGTLTKSGAGTLTLSGANTFNGGLTLNEGTLQLGNSGTVLADALPVTVNGGTFKLGRADETIGSLAGTGGVVELQNGSGHTLTVGGNDASTSFAGVIQGTYGALVKNGTGTLTLSGANTYTASTTINGGTIVISSDANLGVDYAPVGFNSGTLRTTADITAVRELIMGATGGTIQAGGAFTLTTPISGSGPLTSTGTGTLTLTGAQTYTGATNIQAGLFKVESGSLASALVNVSSGATLYFSNDGSTYAGDISGGGVFRRGGAGTTTLTGAATHSGGTTIESGTLQIGGGGTAGSLTGSVTNNGTLSFNRSDNITFSDVISGSGSVAQAGSGTLTLSGANTYSGGTGLTAGTLSLGSSGALGSTGPISFGGGTLQFSANNTTDYSSRFSTAANQAYRFDTNSQSVTLGSALTSFGGSLTKTGQGTLTLSGANTYTGTTTVSGGTLLLGAANSFPTGGTLTVTGGSFNLGAFNITAGAVTQSSPGTITGSGMLTASSFSLQGGTMSVPLGGTGGVTKTGTATLTLSGANTYTGGTTVNSGILAVSTNAGLGAATGAVTLNGGTLQANGSFTAVRTMTLAASGTVDVAGSQTLTWNGAIAGAAGNSLTKSGLGTLTLGGANTYAGDTFLTKGTLALGASNSLPAGSPLTVSLGTFNLAGFNATAGAVTLNSGSITGPGTLTAPSFTAVSGTISAALAGTGGLVKTAAIGQVTLSGTNTYSGGTTINGGTLSVSANANLGAANGTVTFGGGTLRTTASFTALRPIVLATGGGTIESFTATTLTWNGDISGTAGNSLTKIGGGPLVLGGSNTYSGDTIVNAGTLQLGGTHALPSGGALTLGGGTLATGGFTPASALGTLTLNSSSTIDFGSGASALTFGNSSAVAWTGTLSILNYTSGADSLRFGTDSSGLTATQLNQISFGGLFAQIDANGFVSPVSAIPEPSTYGTLLGAAALGLAWRQRTARRFTTS